jgi:hypothetical protein
VTIVIVQYELFWYDANAVACYWYYDYALISHY